MLIEKTFAPVFILVMKRQPYLDIRAAAHKGVWQSAKVQTFVAVLKPHFRKHRADFIADPA